MHPETIDAIGVAADDPAERAEAAQPSGYNAYRITEPPAALDAEIARLAISDVATDLTMLRMQRDAGTLTDEKLDGALARSARTLRTIVAGLAVAALAVVALVASPAPRAAAAEAPEPDPIAVSITLTAGTVRVSVPVTTRTATPAGYHCASVYGPTSYGRGFVGRACSRYARFLVPVTLDSRFVPVGRSSMAVVDDVDPLASYPTTVTLTALRPSRFQLGTWTPTCYGDGLTVTAPLQAYTPAAGTWTPQNASPVYLQERRAGRWVTVAKGTTNRYGIVTITATLGGGLHTVRVARPAGATVTATTGTARTFYLVPTDVPVDVI